MAYLSKKPVAIIISLHNIIVKHMTLITHTKSSSAFKVNELLIF